MKTTFMNNAWAIALLTQARNGLSALASSRVFWTSCIAVFAIVVLPSLAHAAPEVVDVFNKKASASTAGLDDGLSDFVIILYRIFKVVAVIVGCLGVWRLMEGDYKWAVSCAVCFFALFFMPTIVEVFQGMGASALNKV
jgi:hypothetical protein